MQRSAGDHPTRRDILTIYTEYACQPCGLGCPIGSPEMLACLTMRVQQLPPRPIATSTEADLSEVLDQPA